MRVDILTIFPEMLRSPLEHSILKRAQESGRLQVRLIDIREFSTDRHRTVDDMPYGGGAGMVMKPEPIFRAVEQITTDGDDVGPGRIILMTPQGEPFDQSTARELADQRPGLLLIAGRYEGFDERVRTLVDREISIGDYVLSGGELPAMVVIEAVARLIPSVLGNPESLREESFGDSTDLEYPQYTRPEEFRGMRVPEVLLSGNHAKIREWRAAESRKRTARRRPDLIPARRKP